MTRVLFISHAVEFAGAEIALVRFIALLDRTRFEPVLLVPREGGLQQIIPADVPVVRVYYDMTLEIGWDDPRILRQIRVLRDVITSQQPDLIVVNTDMVPQAIIAALLTDIPLMVQLQAFIVKEQFEALPASARFADTIWLPFADHILACSHWVSERYAPLLGRSIEVIPNTLGVIEAVPYPLDGAQPLIVMLASLEDNKRPVLFIEAAAGLRRKYPRLRFRCRIYGDGTPDYTAHLQALIEMHALSDIFSLHARVADTNPIYQACAVVFVPSAFEAFSLVTIEAAAHRRPVIATRSGGPSAIVIDGETGFLIDVDDLDAAVNRMAALLRNPAMAASMGENARQRYLTHYAPEVVAGIYQAALDATIQSAANCPERRRLARPFARYFLNATEMENDGAVS